MQDVSKPSRIGGTVAALALLVAGLWLATVPVAAEGAGEHSGQRTITVSGSGRASAPPDMAVVRLGIETQSAEVKRALGEAAQRMSAIGDALRHAGIPASDLQTVDYSVGFVASPPRSGGPSSGAPAGYFRVTDIAAVTVRDLSRLGAVLDGALSAGANRVQGISFQLSDPAPLEKRARSEAYAEAHARALELASLSGNRLGKVLQISSTGSPAPISGTAVHAVALAAPSVNPGELAVNVSLLVVYAIAK